MCRFPSPIGDELLRFAQNSFEKQQAATCRFSKMFCENSGNVVTNRKEGKKSSKENSAPINNFQNSFIHSKAFSVKQQRIKFNLIRKGRV
jgi:hypothetical protein